MTKRKAEETPDLGVLIDRRGGNAIVAALMGKHEVTVWRWRTRARRPTLGNARDLAVVLGVSTDDIIRLTQESAA